MKIETLRTRVAGDVASREELENALADAFDSLSRQAESKGLSVAWGTLEIDRELVENHGWRQSDEYTYYVVSAVAAGDGVAA